jgi:hypothetical protein
MSWITADSAAAIDAGLADLAEILEPATADLPVEQRRHRGDHQSAVRARAAADASLP